VIVEPVGFPELRNLADFHKLINFAELAILTEKRPNSWKSLNSWKTEDKRKGFLLPGQPLFIN